jgi:hypothetical protein
MAGKGDDAAARGDGPPDGAGGAGGPRAAGGLPRGPARGRRWLARLAFAAAIVVVVVVVLLFGGLKSIAALLLGLRAWRSAARRRSFSWLTAAWCAGWRRWSWSPRRCS